MDAKWTPHDLEVFLHHAVGDNEWPRGNTNAHKSSVEKLQQAGFFSGDPSFETLTEVGKVFLRKLRRTVVEYI